MLVSILIPCHNAERWIAQCIESALGQTWPDKEVIVVDDGSTDGSLAIIQSFGDRIRVESGPNCGGNVARNRLLKLARGEWLQYLDADDYLLPEKIEKQMHFLAQFPAADIVFGPHIQELCENGKVSQNLSVIPNPLDPWSLLVRWDLPQTGAMLWRKQAVQDVGGWKEDQVCCQEHKLCFHLLKAEKQFAYCADSGAVYRQWSEGSVSTRNPQMVHHWRIEIIRAAEKHLREQGLLTLERLWAVNQARLEIARLVWSYDKEKAVEIARVIHGTQPSFLPEGPGRRISYSLAYRIGYRLLGFSKLERLAGIFRTLVKRKETT